MTILPAKLREKVLVRDNVIRNILSLSRPERKDLWRSLSKIIKTSLFHVHKRLDQSLQVKTDDGVKIFGSIIRQGYIAIVQISIDGLKLFSVISRRRLMASKKTKKCVLVNEIDRRGGLTVKTFAGIDEQKNIIWRHEVREELTNKVLECSGTYIFTYKPLAA